MHEHDVEFTAAAALVRSGLGNKEYTFTLRIRTTEAMLKEIVITILITTGAILMPIVAKPAIIDSFRTGYVTLFERRYHWRKHPFICGIWIAIWLFLCAMMILASLATISSLISHL